MSGYFRDRFQGAGAIAAAAPAPRSAPAPTVRALRARRGGRWHLHGMGAIQVDNEGGGGGQPGRPNPIPLPPRPPRPGRPPPPSIKAQFAAVAPVMTPVLAPPQAPPKLPTIVLPTATVSSTPPAPGYLPPRQPVKANTAGGGAGWSGSPAHTGPALTQMAPPDEGEAITVPEGSAMTGGLPKGAAKLWLALGLGAAAYFGYRHFKKRRRR